MPKNIPPEIVNPDAPVFDPKAWNRNGIVDSVDDFASQVDDLHSALVAEGITNADRDNYSRPTPVSHCRPIF